MNTLFNNVVSEIQKYIEDTLYDQLKEKYFDEDYFQNGFQVRYYRPFSYLVNDYKFRPRLSYTNERLIEHIEDTLKINIDDVLMNFTETYIEEFAYELNSKLKSKYGVELSIVGRCGGWWGIALEDAYDLLEINVNVDDIEKLFKVEILETIVDFFNNYYDETDDSLEVKEANSVAYDIADLFCYRYEHLILENFDKFIDDNELIECLKYIDNMIDKYEKYFNEDLYNYLKEKYNINVEFF